MDDLREGPLDQNIHRPLAARLRGLGGPDGAYGLASVVLGLAAALGTLLVSRPIDWLLPASLLFAATIAARARTAWEPTDHRLDLALFAAVWLAFTWRASTTSHGVFPLAALAMVSVFTQSVRHAQACRRFAGHPGALNPVDTRRLYAGSMRMAGLLAPGTHLAILYATLAGAAIDLPTSFGAAVLLIALGLNAWVLLVASAWRRAEALAHGLAGDDGR